MNPLLSLNRLIFGSESYGTHWDTAITSLIVLRLARSDPIARVPIRGRTLWYCIVVLFAVS